MPHTEITQLQATCHAPTAHFLKVPSWDSIVGIRLLRVRFCSPRPFSTAGTRLICGRVLPLDGWKSDTNGRFLRWLCHASLFHGSYQVGSDLDRFGWVTGYRYSFSSEEELTRAIVNPAKTWKELASPSSCAARPPNFCFRLAILKTKMYNGGKQSLH